MHKRCICEKRSRESENFSNKESTSTPLGNYPGGSDLIITILLCSSSQATWIDDRPSVPEIVRSCRMLSESPRFSAHEVPKILQIGQEGERQGLHRSSQDSWFSNTFWLSSHLISAVVTHETTLCATTAVAESCRKLGCCSTSVIRITSRE